MNKKTGFKLAYIFLLSAFLVFSLGGCSLFAKKDAVKNPSSVNQVQDDSKQVIDISLQDKIKSEKGVKNAMAYTQNKTAVAVIVTEKSVKKEEARKIADKYAKELREKYKNYKVTVQAYVEGKEWIHINLD